MPTDPPDLIEVVDAQMPLGTTLGVTTFGGADEVEATLAWAPEPLQVPSFAAATNRPVRASGPQPKLASGVHARSPGIDSQGRRVAQEPKCDARAGTRTTPPGTVLEG